MTLTLGNPITFTTKEGRVTLPVGTELPVLYTGVDTKFKNLSFACVRYENISLWVYRSGKHLLS